MSSNPYAQFTGVPMDSDEIDDLLTTQGYGIVSLCQGGEPYSIPISFGYDGDHIYFGLLEASPNPRKMEYIDEGVTARLLVTEINGRFEWQSVAITGPVRSIDRESEEWDHFMDTLDDNGWFAKSFERSAAVESIQGWELQIDELTGIERTEEVYD